MIFFKEFAAGRRQILKTSPFGCLELLRSVLVIKEVRDTGH